MTIAPTIAHVARPPAGAVSTGTADTAAWYAGAGTGDASGWTGPSSNRAHVAFAGAN